MKRKSATPRSFLRQLAEPVPRNAAPLIPRRAPSERRAPTRSSLDAIPRVIGVTETRNTPAVEPRLTQAASPIARRTPPRRTKTSARSVSSQVNTTTSKPAAHAQPAEQPSVRAAEAILQSTIRKDAAAQAKAPLAAAQESPRMQSVLAHSVLAEATSPFSPAPPRATAKTERRPDISVHIGTIEVRVPAPPARTPQPAPAALNPRISQNAVPHRASESLSRSLAWSHGLVQG